MNRDLGLQFAAAQKAYTVTKAAHHARRLEDLRRDFLFRIDLSGVNGLLQASDGDFLVLLGENIGETVLGKAAVQRHLATLETLKGNAGTGLLALHATAAGPPLARSRTTPDPHGGAARTRIIFYLIKFHSQPVP